MQYTVMSRGRALGVTNLEFVRYDPRIRSGWFHPNALGERVMPVIAAVLPAVCRVVEASESTGGGAITRTTEFSDLVESLQHVETLALQLRAEDGSIVPTDLLGLQDTERLLALANLERVDSGRGVAPETSSGDAGGAGVDDQQGQHPRYQIHIRLTVDNAIP